MKKYVVNIMLFNPENEDPDQRILSQGLQNHIEDRLVTIMVQAENEATVLNKIKIEYKKGSIFYFVVGILELEDLEEDMVQ